MYQWLSEAVENNSIVITASRRLARVLHSEYGKEQLALGNKAWLSPNIRFLDDWLTSTVNAAADSLPIVLASHASGIIWERCLKEQAGAALLNIGGLVRQARQSWQRLHDWRVPLSEVSTEARSQDEQLFAAAARKYQEILADNGWIDDAQVAGMVTGLIESRAVPAPESVVYAGFDRLVPAVEHLFAVLTDIGCVVTAAQFDAAAEDVLVAAFDNADGRCLGTAAVNGESVRDCRHHFLFAGQKRRSNRKADKRRYCARLAIRRRRSADGCKHVLWPAAVGLPGNKHCIALAAMGTSRFVLQRNQPVAAHTVYRRNGNSRPMQT